jgi:hypothetical protein
MFASNAIKEDYLFVYPNIFQQTKHKKINISTHTHNTFMQIKTTKLSGQENKRLQREK